jgi:RNA polymerase sigma-70 factor (ECF subfamily)
MPQNADEAVLEFASLLSTSPAVAETVLDFARRRGGHVEADEVNHELIERARAGDLAALGELLEKYRGFLWRLADQGLDDRAAGRIDASDVVQQTCLSVHRQILKFDGRDSAQFIAWLRQIHENNIRNAARNQLHAAKRAIDREKRVNNADIYSDPRATPSQHIVRNEESDRLASAIEQLPPDEREALERRYLNDESMADIAAGMGLTRSALVWLMNRAMTNLRKNLN